MPRSKVVEADYYEFVNLLQRASDSGKRIEQSDPRWAEYVKVHKVNVVAALSIARQKFENIQPVIIDEGRDTDGLYFYSKLEEACLRLVPYE